MKKYFSLYSRKIIFEISVSFFLTAVISFGAVGCRTTDDVSKNNKFEVLNKNEEVNEADANALNEMIEENKKEAEIQKKEKKDLSNVEDPSIVFLSTEEKCSSLTGTEALKKNLQDKTVEPEYEDGRLKGWIYKEQEIYQVHTQTYHSTIIQLEPGEEMLEVPFLSEPDVWRMSRGVGVKEGKPTQFIIIKPDYSGLESTMIIITNLRVYQLTLKSYKDNYMPYVKWVYYRSIEDMDSWNSYVKNSKNKEELVNSLQAGEVNTNYLIKHSKKKPSWCPTMVFDDGKYTYIVLDEKCVNTQIPAVFKNSKEIINKQYTKNVITIYEQIEKITLKLGKDKVVITKRKDK